VGMTVVCETHLEEEHMAAGAIRSKGCWSGCKKNVQR
jgi:hypothetical protein